MSKPIRFSIELCPPLKPDRIGAYYEKFKILFKYTNLVSISSHPSKDGQVSGFERSFNLANYMLAKKNGSKLDLLFHMTCYDLDHSNIASRLGQLNDLGVERILIISGEYYTASNEDGSSKQFLNSTELVRHIMDQFKHLFRSIAVGGYPTSSKRPVFKMDIVNSFDCLSRKISFGVDTIYTQCVFDSPSFKLFREQVSGKIGPDVKVVPSIALFEDHQSLQKCLRLMRVHADDNLQEMLERIEPDKARDHCKSFIVNLCYALREVSTYEDEVTINICAFDLFDLSADIMETVLGM